MEIDWASDYWTAVGGLSAAATAVVAIGTLIRAGRDSRERTRPVVIAEYRVPAFGFNILELVVRNIGASVARNVKVSFDPPLVDQGTGESTTPFVIARYANPIPALGPGQELVNAVYIDDDDPDDSDLPPVLTVTIEYDRWRKVRRYRDTFRLLSTVYMKHTVGRASDAPEGRLKEIRDKLSEQTAALKSIRDVLKASGAVGAPQLGPSPHADGQAKKPPSAAARLWAQIARGRKSI